MLSLQVRLSGFITIALLATAAPPLAAEARVRAPAVLQKTPAVVAAANPLAVDAGIEILRAGGSAADAAVAMQAMLGLVEPQSSGVGGGGFMLYYNASSAEIAAIDGREKAPAGATPDMFLDAAGKPLT